MTCTADRWFPATIREPGTLVPKRVIPGTRTWLVILLLWRVTGDGTRAPHNTATRRIIAVYNIIITTRIIYVPLLLAV